MRRGIFIQGQHVFSASALVIFIGVSALLTTFFNVNSFVSTAQAQSIDFSSGGDNPIEISAENGIEWQKNNMVFIARGNAKAIRREVTIQAKELRAFYREKATGGTDIWRLDAINDVRIQSPTETITGEKAVYDVENAILVISGREVRMVTKTDVITADKQIEYWELKQMAVARGHATVTHEGSKMQADILSAYFTKDTDGKSRVHRIEGFNAVQIDTKQDRATADRGVYNVDTGVATLTGSVKITRDGNILQGCQATINLNSGISNLRNCDNTLNNEENRVSGLFRKKKKTTPDNAVTPQ